MKSKIYFLLMALIFLALTITACDRRKNLL
jgi:hypothetical protein